MAIALFPNETRSSLYKMTQSSFIKNGFKWNLSTNSTLSDAASVLGSISFWDFQNILALQFQSSYSEGNGPGVLFASEIVEAIAKLGKHNCLYITFQEDFIWQYKLFINGNRAADFCKFAGYFDEVEEGGCGDPVAVAELFNVPVSCVAPYHLKVISNENYETVLLDKSVEHSSGDGNHRHGQPHQGFDFATALGADVGEIPPSEEWTISTV